MPEIKDEDGRVVKAGHIIVFTYGIPPVVVRAEVVRRAGHLVALCPGHKPPECRVDLLRKHVGEFHIDTQKKRAP